MEQQPVTLMQRILALLFPHTPDFYGMLVEQCGLVADAMDRFVEFMHTGDAATAAQVRAMEHEGDRNRLRIIDALNRSFSTPFDREDIYRAAQANDEVLNYAKTTIREMEVLEIEPDADMLAMAQLLAQGARALHAGYAKLAHAPLEAEGEASTVRKVERRTENLYRAAVARLLDLQHYLAGLHASEHHVDEDVSALLEPVKGEASEAVSRAISFVLHALKKREVYRHLSNAADHLAHAGEVLHDIAVKTA